MWWNPTAQFIFLLFVTSCFFSFSFIQEGGPHIFLNNPRWALSCKSLRTPAQEDLQHSPHRGSVIVSAQAAVFAGQRRSVKGPLGGEHILFSSFLHLFCHDGVSEGQMKASLARDCNRTLYKYLPFKGHFKAVQRPVVMLIFMIFFYSGWVRLLFLNIYSLSSSCCWISQPNITLILMFYIMPEGCVYRVDTSKWFIWLHHEHLGLEK